MVRSALEHSVMGAEWLRGSLRGAVLLVVVLVAACTSGDSTTMPSDANVSVQASGGEANGVVDGRREIPIVGATMSYEVAAPDSGVASSIVALNKSVLDVSEFAVTDRDVPLAFALRSCETTPTGVRHVIQWRPPPQVELPVTVQLWAGAGGIWGALYAQPSEVVLEKAGVFVLETQVFDEFSFEFSDLNEVSREALDSETPCALHVLSEKYIDDQTDPGLTYINIDELPTIDAPAGTVQWLAGQDRPVSMLLRQLLGRLGPDHDVFPDRWWLAAGVEPERLSLDRYRLCWSVRSDWSDPAVQVRQSRGCEPVDVTSDDPTQPVRVVEKIADDRWNVEVTGAPEEVEEFVDLVEPYPVVGVEPVPLDGVDFDPVATLEADFAESGHDEIARFEWGDDGLIIVTSAGNENYPSEINAWADRPGFNGGSGGGSSTGVGHCVATNYTSNGEVGFAIASFVQDRIRTLEVEREPGVWEEVEIVGSGDLRVALVDADVDADPNTGWAFPKVRGFNADGGKIGCVR